MPRRVARPAVRAAAPRAPLRRAPVVRPVVARPPRVFLGWRPRFWVVRRSGCFSLISLFLLAALLMIALALPH